MQTELKLTILQKINSLGKKIIDSSDLYISGIKQDAIIKLLLKLIKEQYIFGMPKEDETGKDVVFIENIKLLSKGRIHLSTIAAKD